MCNGSMVNAKRAVTQKRACLLEFSFKLGIKFIGLKPKTLIPKTKRNQSENVE
jgi:hypothetical protein